ncbi:MAG: hypothetical protein SwBeaMacB_23580 [Shewanella algae]
MVANPDRIISYVHNIIHIFNLAVKYIQAFKSHELEIDVLDAHYGEESGTARGHYAEFAVALTNLGIHAGMKQPVVDPFIPQGLVWVKPN